AAEAHVAGTRRLACALQRPVDAVGNEVEGGATLHGYRCARVIGQNEHRTVVLRVVAPPSLPGVVRPGSANRAEHVAAEDPGADVVEAPPGEAVIDARVAALLSEHLADRASGQRPAVQPHAADAQWVVEALVGSSAIAVERNGEGVHAKFGHGWIFPALVGGSLCQRGRTIRSSADVV